MNNIITKNPEILLDPIVTTLPGPLADFDEEKGEFYYGEQFFLPIRARKPLFFETFVNQNDSVESSIERYVAQSFVKQNSVLAVYCQKIRDSLSFFTLTEDDSEETIDSILEQERFVYGRFPELDIEFHILLGRESENLVPTGSTLVLGKI